MRPAATPSARAPPRVPAAYAESGYQFRDARDWERALAIMAALGSHLDDARLDELATMRRQESALAHVRAGTPSPWRGAARGET